MNLFRKKKDREYACELALANDDLRARLARVCKERDEANETVRAQETKIEQMKRENADYHVYVRHCAYQFLHAVLQGDEDNKTDVDVMGQLMELTRNDADTDDPADDTAENEGGGGIG